MEDIRNRGDLMLLMTKFYEKLLSDPSISYFFTDIARIDLAHHLPLLVDFWDSILFQSDTYRRNAMQPHIALHRQSPMESRHFDTWLRYFKETVDELFEGDNARLIKERASGIASIMRLKTS